MSGQRDSSVAGLDHTNPLLAINLPSTSPGLGPHTAVLIEIRRRRAGITSRSLSTLWAVLLVGVKLLLARRLVFAPLHGISNYPRRV